MWQLKIKMAAARHGGKMLALLLASLVTIERVYQVAGSVHEVYGKTTGCRFTERMFASGQAPWSSGGRSSVTVNATLRPLEDGEVADTITVHRLGDYFDFGVAVASFSVGGADQQLDEHTICSINFSDPTVGNKEGLLYGEFWSIEDRQNITINTEFTPTSNSLQVVMLVPCWKQKSESFGYPVSADEFSMYPMVDPLLFMDVAVSFRNPYGYLPALLWGLYPFNGILAVLYGVVAASFLALVWQHRASTIGLHYFVLAVLLLSTAETASWFATFKMLNESGQPACCPYSAMIILSTFLRIVAGMVARIATTLICLGYGIVRPQISWPEVFVVSGLGVCYFIAVGALEISHISNQSDGEVQPPAVWEALVITTNSCFIGWIFTSLALTRRNLAAFGQTAKLKMYSALHTVLLTYFVLSFFLTAIEGAVYSSALAMKWPSVWVVWAANRLVFFCILVVVAWIWRPKPNSQLYAHMDQVPSREPVTPASIARALELTQRVTSAEEDDTPKNAFPSTADAH